MRDAVFVGACVCVLGRTAQDDATQPTKAQCTQAQNEPIGWLQWLNAPSRTVRRQLVFHGSYASSTRCVLQQLLDPLLRGTENFTLRS